MKTTPLTRAYTDLHGQMHTNTRTPIHIHTHLLYTHTQHPHRHAPSNSERGNTTEDSETGADSKTDREWAASRATPTQHSLQRVCMSVCVCISVCAESMQPVCVRVCLFRSSSSAQLLHSGSYPPHLGGSMNGISKTPASYKHTYTHTHTHTHTKRGY